MLATELLREDREADTKCKKSKQKKVLNDKFAIANKVLFRIAFQPRSSAPKTTFGGADMIMDKLRDISSEIAEIREATSSGFEQASNWL
jgi:hypothetical protein